MNKKKPVVGRLKRKVYKRKVYKLWTKKPNSHSIASPNSIRYSLKFDDIVLYCVSFLSYFDAFLKSICEIRGFFTYALRKK
jgi:hypothetical protein